MSWPWYQGEEKPLSACMLNRVIQLSATTLPQQQKKMLFYYDCTRANTSQSTEDCEEKQHYFLDIPTFIITATGWQMTEGNRWSD